jgi:energy-coupling factor transporter ATP-binding protein EcfA2
MHVTKIEIRNVKNLLVFSWELGSGDVKAGWHVLLGDNGAGKSTLLKACAVALLGPKNAIGLRLSYEDWISSNQSEARVTLTINQDEEFDQWSGRGPIKAGPLKLGIRIDGNGIDAVEHTPSPNRHVWGSAGWFSASFGPYRRFSGGGKEYEKLFYSMPKLASHLSIFGEDIALSETLVWLKELHYQQLDDEKRGLHQSSAKAILNKLKAFINQDGFLPNGSKLEEIGPKGVMFKDPAGALIEITSLSDGFRSILSMTLELIRQLGNSFGFDKMFNEDVSQVMPSGVVIIDEIDVHLHPRWQRTIGPWMTAHFPNIQFLVTTHSPLVCQGATHGSITKLPNPGEPGTGGRVTGIALDKLLYGDILDALGSGAFGEGIERSLEGQEKLVELATLNVRARRGTLSKEDEARRQNLQEIFGMQAETGAPSA